VLFRSNCAATQPFTDNWDFHEIGIDEFLALCHELGVEPALTLNIDPKVCTPEDAAAWVEYCNGSPRTTWGNVRARRGHPAPYRVKYWFVGNEIWGDWMGAAHCDASTYARRLTLYASAIRKVDLSVVLIASGVSPDWDRTVVAEAGSSFDLLSEHNYAPDGNAHSRQPANLEYAHLLHSPKGDVFSMLQTAQRTARAAAPHGRKIRTVFDEWNVWHNWFADPSHHEWRIGPIDACFVAAMLNMFCRESERLDLVFAAYFQPVQEGAIRVQPFSAELTPVGQVFALYQIHQAGRRLPLDMPRGLGIDGFASLSPDGRNARVTLVNLRGGREATVQLALPNGNQFGNATFTSLIATDLSPDVPLHRHTDRLEAKDGQFHVPVPRYGMVLVEISLKPADATTARP
jgi:alpha-L-arabinofuranosidase